MTNRDISAYKPADKKYIIGNHIELYSVVVIVFFNTCFTNSLTTAETRVLGNKIEMLFFLLLFSLRPTVANVVFSSSNCLF